MNKIFKIYISFCVCISTLSVLCTTSMAKDIVVENEYLVLKNNLEQAQSKFYLQENAKTINDIIDAEDAISNYKKHIYSLQLKSDEELSFYGYDENQIYAIKNYDGSDYYSTLASSTVTAKAKKLQFNYSSSNNITTVRAQVTFTWSGIPAFHYTNSSAIGFEADNGNNFQEITSVSSSLEYHEFVDVGDTRVTAHQATNYGDAGINGSYAWTFPVRRDGDVYFKYLKEAIFIATGRVTGDLNYFNFRYLYAYKKASVGASFGISISSSPSGSIGLSVKSYYEALPANGSDRITTFY